MRRAKVLTKLVLALALTFSAGALSGCEDENDPKTWVKKLDNDARRAGALTTLHRMYESTLATTNPPNDPAAPASRAFLEVALEPVVQAFVAHPDELIGRREAIEILAQSQDLRAVPGLISALTFRPNNADSERIALRAAQALRELAPRIPAAQQAQVAQALLGAVDRAQGASGNPVQIRYHSIGALGAIRATSAVETLSRLLSRNLADQDVSTARAAADALGEIGDPRGVDSLVYGLYLNLRGQNAFPHCQRALARIGSQAVVPKLVQTLQGQNQQVNTLIQQYQNIPGAPPPPAGLVKTTAASVLRAFAAPEAIDPLLALLNNRQEDPTVRNSASEALAYTAIANAPHRQRILQAITAAFREERPSADSIGSAGMVAAHLAVIGDPTSVQEFVTAIRTPALQAADRANLRLDLLLPLASLIRHGDVPTFQPLAASIRTHLEGFAAQSPREVRPLLAALTRLDAVVSVVRECEDGATACYVRKLGDSSAEVVRKAAYMIAWTTPEAERNTARAAVLERVVSHPDMAVRRSLMVALDALSPNGAPEVITRLEQMIRDERSQDSKILSHLEAQLLIARLRARGRS